MDEHRLADLERLPQIVRRERLRRGLSYREVEEQTGVGFASLCRFELGHLDIRLSTAVKLTRWLGRKP